MESIKILFIEDEPAQIGLYKDVVEMYNKKSLVPFEYEICNDFKSGKEALATPFYDAAIIDLKLSTGELLEGMELVHAVHKKLRIPIVIYSGSISQIDDIEETSLLKKRSRTTELRTILSEVEEIYKTGITRLLRPEGSIDNLLTEIFWNHLDKDIQLWIKHNNPKTLQRYVFSHLQEHMEVNSAGDFEEYHPAEVYIKPSIKKNLHTGDLVKMEDNYLLVLTPACDIVIQRYVKDAEGNEVPVRRADNIVLALVEPFDPNRFCTNASGGLNKGKITELVKNNNYRYHYLPTFEGNDGFLVDFQQLRSLRFEDVAFDRVATVSNAFAKDIISRFSLYYGRQGQPTFEQSKIVEELYEKHK